MKIFIDSADLNEIREINSYGILDGVTTNPSLIKKAAEKYEIKDLKTYIKKILKICKGKPVSLEVIGSSYEEIVREGKKLFKIFNPIAKNVYIKIPVNPCIDNKKNSADGIKAIRELSKKNIPVNCTLVFTPEQALLAAKAGAKLVSPFAGRIDDYLRDKNKIKYEKEDYYPKNGLKKANKIIQDNGIISGVDLVSKISLIFDLNKINCKVLAASIRNNQQFRECAEVGADIATLPYKVIKSLLEHPKTKEGMKKFTKDIVPEYRRVLK